MIYFDLLFTLVFSLFYVFSDKETQHVMRFMAIPIGTFYVFINIPLGVVFTFAYLLSDAVHNYPIELD